MLSRFAYGGGANLQRSLVKFQPITGVIVSAPFSSSSPRSDVPADLKSAAAGPSKTGHPPEFPPPTSKRDFVNFPRLTIKERAPPVRFGFIPDSWFQFFYPKTGYTGPYMLIFGGTTYILSKEILPYDHNTVHLHSLVLLIMFIHLKYGDKIGEAYNKMIKEELDFIEELEVSERAGIKENLKNLNATVGLRDDIIEVLKGRIENIYLQMEMHYRTRLEDTYKLVKSKLDCQAELESAEKRVAQRNLMDYVLRNVMKSITPELEANMMKNCISHLNTLSAKA